MEERGRPEDRIKWRCKSTGQGEKRKANATRAESTGVTRANGKSVRRNEGTRRIELSCPYCAMLVSPITIAGGLYEKREARGVGE